MTTLLAASSAAEARRCVYNFFTMVKRGRAVVNEYKGTERPTDTFHYWIIISH